MNHMVHRADGRTPFQTLASLDSAPLKVSDFHTFGCPCYVLDPRLQSGLGQIPKWEPRSRMGIYIGRSPLHASNVGLILNPRTGHVSPQFHVVYDDDFTTVPYLRSAKFLCIGLNWSKLLPILKFILSDKWAHGNLFRSLVQIQEIFCLNPLKHLLPLLTKIAREKQCILRLFLQTWTHPTMPQE